MAEVTMQDIAERAGVSKASVSYVLSGKRRLSAEVEKRILQAVKELDYAPHQVAPVLGKVETRVIGFGISLGKGRIAEDPYYLNLIEGAMDCAAEDGYQLVIHRLNPEDGNSRKLFLESLRFLDGMILCNPRKDHIFESEMRKSAIPYVLNGTPEDIDTEFFVDSDIKAIGFQAAEHLIRSGYRNILYINLTEDMIQSKHRLEGFRLAHEDAGLEWKESNHHFCDVTVKDSCDLMMRILEDDKTDFTAVVTSNEIQGRGVIKALHEKGIPIPDKMAVISMGGSCLAEIGHPQLTTIDFSPYRAGFESARMLIEVITRKRLRPSHLIIPGKLVVRESTWK